MPRDFGNAARVTINAVRHGIPFIIMAGS